MNPMKKDPFNLVLQKYLRVHKFAVTPGLLAKLSGIPKATIVNWLEGRVLRPRRWQDVVAVADALRLDESGVSELLDSSEQPGLAKLIESANSDEMGLLGLWAGPNMAEASTKHDQMSLNNRATASSDESMVELSIWETLSALQD
jgi:hypothetical protein